MPKSYAKTKAEDLKKEGETKEFLQSAKVQLVNDELRSTLRSIMSYFHDVIFPPYIKAYKNKFLYAGDRALYLQKNKMTDKSNRKYPLISSVHDTYFSNTYDTETNIKAIPQAEDDKEKTQIVQQFTERGFSVSGADDVYKLMDYEACLVGSAYGKVWYDNHKKKIIYKKNGVEATKTIEKSNPSISYVDIFSLYFNPGHTDFYKTPKFWRDIAAANAAREKYKTYLSDVSDEEWQYILETPKYFSTCDYRKVKMLKGYEGAMLRHNDKCARDLIDNPGTADLSFTDDNIYNVDFSTNLVEVIEYVEPREDSTRFVLIINGYQFYDGVSELPFDGDDFIRVAWKEVPGSMFPIGIAQILDPIQDNVDNFINNRCDVINQMSNPAYMADKGVFGPDTPQVLSLKPRKVYERVQGKVLERINAVDPNAVSSLLSGIQFFINQAYELIALNAYSQGGEGKVERSNGAAQIKANILKTALIPFIRNKNKTLTKTAQIWMAFARVFMPPEFSVRILGADGNAEFVTITVDDILNQFDFEFDNYSMRSLSRIEDRASITAALQSIQDKNTRAALESKLLDTFDIQMPTMEDKKKVIDEQVELEKYTQEKMQSIAPAPTPGGAPVPPGSMESTMVPEVASEAQLGEVPPRERPVVAQ